MQLRAPGQGLVDGPGHELQPAPPVLIGDAEAKVAGQQRMMSAQAGGELLRPAEHLGEPHRHVLGVGGSETGEHRRQQRILKDVFVERAAQPAETIDTANVFIQASHDTFLLN
ncbi:MAG TPA: hypothetical protein VGG75_09005 [Trebonia sp.]|jgi:hypothetical protein